jgi:hypothetical protein
MRKFILILIIMGIFIVLDVHSTYSNPLNKISAIMIFKVNFYNGIEPVTDKSFTPISEARFIVIDRNGKIIKTGLSNKKGEWIVPLSTEVDPRFPTKQMATITLITIAKGFNELVFFNVSVKEHGNGKGGISVTLHKVDPSRRNEPQFLNAELIHRFTIFDTLDYYAKLLGLTRQPQIDVHSIQWGPDIKEKMY